MIGRHLRLRFNVEENARRFISGYRSGMARIWRTTYEWPSDVDSYLKRGYRYAWVMHIYGRKFLNEEFPEAYLISEDFDERLLYTGFKSPRVTCNCRAIDGGKSEKTDSIGYVVPKLRDHEEL